MPWVPNLWPAELNNEPSQYEKQKGREGGVATFQALCSLHPLLCHVAPFLARCRWAQSFPARCPPGPASDSAGPMAEEGMQSRSWPRWACEFSRPPCQQAWPPASFLPLGTICVCLPASPLVEEQGKAGLEEIPAGGVGSRAAGCVPRIIWGSALPGSGWGVPPSSHLLRAWLAWHPVPRPWVGQGVARRFPFH